MRLFMNLEEAHSEIKRDLSKSPEVHSSQVQNLKVETDLHEAIAYSYALLSIPHSARDLCELMVKLGALEESQTIDYSNWLLMELDNRLYSDEIAAEYLHPDLSKLYEGNAPSYTYSDRMVGMLKVIPHIFKQDLFTRRAYWPIFYPQDTMRARRTTRIPCTLGYQFLVREAADKTLSMSIIVSQRSCDFGRFWFSDLWLAYRILHKMRERVQPEFPIHQGRVIHIVHSFHSFITEEVY